MAKIFPGREGGSIRRGALIEEIRYMVGNCRIAWYYHADFERTKVSGRRVSMLISFRSRKMLPTMCCQTASEWIGDSAWNTPHKRISCLTPKNYRPGTQKDRAKPVIEP